MDDVMMSEKKHDKMTTLMLDVLPAHAKILHNLKPGEKVTLHVIGKVESIQQASEPNEYDGTVGYVKVNVDEVKAMGATEYDELLDD